MDRKKFLDKYIKHLLVALVLIVGSIVVYVLLSKKIDFNMLREINYIESTIQSFGPGAPIVFILIMMLAVIISPLPSMPLTVASGMIWGPVHGAIYSVLGALLGAIVCFSIARGFGKEIVKKMIRKEITLYGQVSDNKLGMIIFIARLLPIFQFDIISYGAGITNISLWRFTLATTLGMIPMTFLFAYSGKIFSVGNIFALILSAILIIGIIISPLIINKTRKKA